MYTVANLMCNLVNQVVEELSKVEGVSKILVAEHEAYKGFLPGIQCTYVCCNQEDLWSMFYFLARQVEVRMSKKENYQPSVNLPVTVHVTMIIDKHEEDALVTSLYKQKTKWIFVRLVLKNKS